jgi:hypothetical protein
MTKIMTPFKRINSILLGIGIAIICAIVLNSCKEEETPDLSDQQEVSVISNATVAESSVDEEIEEIDEQITVSSGGRKSAGCPTVSRDDVAKTITIDFGTECVGPHRTRSGKVIVTYTGTFDDNTANRVITFENYFVDGKQIQGTIYVRNINRNGEGNLTAERELEDFQVTFADGSYHIVNGTTTREWISGEGDGIAGNEVIEVTGSHTGTTSADVSFTRTITTPVIADFNCWSTGGFLRTKGVIEMTITNSVRTRTRVLDYGDGTCDNTVTVTVNGKSYEVNVEG